MTEPWYEVRIGFKAGTQQMAEDFLEDALEVLPYPEDFVASINRSDALSSGEGFEATVVVSR